MSQKNRKYRHPDGYRCFYCQELFTDPDEAKEHFMRHDDMESKLPQIKQAALESVRLIQRQCSALADRIENGDQVLDEDIDGAPASKRQIMTDIMGAVQLMAVEVEGIYTEEAIELKNKMEH